LSNPAPGQLSSRQHRPVAWQRDCGLALDPRQIIELGSTGVSAVSGAGILKMLLILVWPEHAGFLTELLDWEQEENGKK